VSERLIVIGGGGAGIAAATIAKRVDPTLQVSLFTEFEDVAYSPCGIPFVHGREIETFERLFLSTVER
jgi:NADH oxidase (H2O2-forming)